MMQTPIEIAFRHYQPTEEVRAEIASQARRLEQLSARITSCRVVVTGPQSRHRSGDVFDVELRIAMPNHRDIIVDQCCDEAPQCEHALVAIREAFGAARRQIEDVEHRMHDSTKLYAPINRGPVAKVIETKRSRQH
jgi:ribosome-associated translation inhibitor RaiA